MPKAWVPAILRPEYTWPRPIQPHVSKEMPPVPSPTGPRMRRFWGYVHLILVRFSESYCAWFDISVDYQIMDLPFGLVLKRSDRTRVEEVVAMQVARSAGLPVPKVLSCGEHPDPQQLYRISILMTRLPGWPLNNGAYVEGMLDDMRPWVEDLGRCLQAMREWKSPFGSERICSVIDSSISTSRVPEHRMGPFEVEREFHDYLLAPASSHGFSSEEKYKKALERANKIRNLPHRVVFTHGDLKAHNLLVDDDGHLSGFLDWECAGWCPEYWDFTTAMRFGSTGWFYQVASRLGGDQYMAELDTERALTSLTVDSYIG